jgi:hypothetical protein
MITNRASLSDTLTPPSRSPRGKGVVPGVNNQDSSRRLLMVVGGFFLALIAIVAVSVGMAQVWFASTPATGGSVAAETAAARPWEPLAMIVLGGLGFAAGAALVGIGMGRWTAPRPAESEADYTGPGEVEDTPQPPRVV